jgi:hypothetical protein
MFYNVLHFLLPYPNENQYIENFQYIIKVHLLHSVTIVYKLDAVTQYTRKEPSRIHWTIRQEAVMTSDSVRVW